MSASILDKIISSGQFLQQYNLNDLVTRIVAVAQDIKTKNLTDAAAEAEITNQLTALVGDLKVNVPAAQLPKFKSLLAIILEAVGAFGLQEESDPAAFKSITSKVLSLL